MHQWTRLLIHQCSLHLKVSLLQQKFDSHPMPWHLRVVQNFQSNLDPKNSRFSKMQPTKYSQGFKELLLRGKFVKLLKSFLWTYLIFYASDFNSWVQGFGNHSFVCILKAFINFIKWFALIKFEHAEHFCTIAKDGLIDCEVHVHKLWKLKEHYLANMVKM